MATTPAAAAATISPAASPEIECHRLLADDVLARRDRRLGERHMQVVRRADVDDVDPVGGDQLLGALVAALGAELAPGGGGALGAGGGDAGELRPRDPRRPRVDAADEAGPDDARRAAHELGQGRSEPRVDGTLLHDRT